jgi:hypothetical protein
MGFARPRQGYLGLFIFGLICCFYPILIFCDRQCVNMGLEAAKGTFCRWSVPKGLSIANANRNGQRSSY